MRATNEQIRQRLISIRRRVCGDNQSAFANLLGISYQRWNNFEQWAPLSKEVMLRLAEKFDVDLNWLMMDRVRRKLK